MKFLTIKKRSIIAGLLCVLFVGVFCAIYFSIRPTFQPKAEYTIVIDAGHGGIDGGCVGRETKVTESELNLAYSNELASLCRKAGLKVVMTRETMDGLYSPFAENKKRSEMENREKVIKQSNADLFVSIHMNSVPRRSIKGAQVFYKKNNEIALEFANQITRSLKENLEFIRGGSKEGDYYVLNCNDKASVLVECGYLSNSEEELLLQKDEYRQKFCASVMQGVLNYLSV